MRECGVSLVGVTDQERAANLPLHPLTWLFRKGSVGVRGECPSSKASGANQQRQMKFPGNPSLIKQYIVFPSLLILGDNPQYRRIHLDHCMYLPCVVPSNQLPNYPFFQNGPHSFLLIRPVKTEIAHINPTIFIYHDVIYDNEIQIVKELASPRVSHILVR